MSILHKDNNGVIKEYSSGGTIEGLPLGFIFASVFPQSNLNYHLLNGDSLLIADYTDFYTVLTTLISQNWSLSCTANEYAEDIAKTGNCGKFVINTTDSDVTSTYDSTTITVLANSFKLPTITKFIQGLSSLANLGESLEAGLPNITGQLSRDDGYPLINIVHSQSGALQPINATTNYGNQTQATSSTRPRGFSFDASQSNSIYGNSTTVQPQATMYPYYMVVKNNNSTGLISYLNNLAQAGVQSIGGSVGDITLDGLKMTNNVLGLDALDVLWENPNPSSGFSAQTITILDSSNYDFLLIITSYNTDYPSIKSTGIIKNTTGFSFEATVHAHTSNYGSRQYTINSNSQIVITNGLNVNGSSTADSANWAMPYQIYGIKI